MDGSVYFSQIPEFMQSFTEQISNEFVEEFGELFVFTPTGLSSWMLLLRFSSCSEFSAFDRICG